MPKQKNFVSAKLKLSATNRRKLHRGEPTLLKADQMEGGEIEVFMTPIKHKKMLKAHSKKKGMKLNLTPEEMEYSMEHGAGVRDFFKNIGRKVTSGVNKGLRTYREKVRPVIAPALKEVVKQGIKQGAPALAAAAATALGQPQLAVPAAAAAKLVADKYADQATEKLGDVTGAYGLPRGLMLSGYSKDKHGLPMIGRGDAMDFLSGGSFRPAGDSRRHGGAVLQDNDSNFLNTSHPAMNPALPPADNSLPRPTHSQINHGGSFRSAGYGMLGTPMMPRMPEPDFSLPR
jgi:hypothetical protein